MQALFVKRIFFMALLWFSGAAMAQPVTIADSEFAPADWMPIVTKTTGGASQSVSQSASGGNPGAYRAMIHSLPPNSNIVVVHEFLGASYDPSAQGAISSLDYREDHREFNPPFAGAAIGAKPALRQGGVWYFGPDLTFNGLSWQSVNLTGLTNMDFSGPGGSHPDFSASGGVINFGFVRSNTNNSGPKGHTKDSNAASFNTTSGIDNWSYSLQTQSLPVVELAAVDTSAAEAGADVGLFRVSLNMPGGGGDTLALAQDAPGLAVFYTVGGSATPGSDYVALSGTVTIPPGATTADITIIPIDDDLAELDESVTLTLSAGSGYQFGASTSATIVIADNDVAGNVATSVPALSFWGVLVLAIVIGLLGVVWVRRRQCH